MSKWDLFIGVLGAAFIVFLCWYLPIALQIEERGYQERMAKYDWQMEVKEIGIK